MNKPPIETIIGTDVPLRGNKNELHSWCPFCSTDKKQTSDRFVVWKDKQSFWCRQCKKSGDVIKYVILRDGIQNKTMFRKDGSPYILKDFIQACEVLGIALEGSSSTTQQKREKVTPKHEPKEHKPFSQKSQIGFASDSWQKSALDYCEIAFEELQSGKNGALGREYLRKRGITNETIWLKMMLGYSKKWRGQFGDLDVFLPRGIVFPYDVSFLKILAVNVRDMDNGKRKYVKATQSANTLYNGNNLNVHVPAVVVESEIDALSIMQAIPDARLITPVATGSTASSRILDAVADLALCPRVFVAFDSDKAGEDASAWWLEVLAHNAVRLRPTKNDVNDMLVSGENIQKWLGV